MDAQKYSSPETSQMFPRSGTSVQLVQLKSWGGVVIRRQLRPRMSYYRIIMHFTRTLIGLGHNKSRSVVHFGLFLVITETVGLETGDSSSLSSSRWSDGADCSETSDMDPDSCLFSSILSAHRMETTRRMWVPPLRFMRPFDISRATGRDSDFSEGCLEHTRAVPGQKYCFFGSVAERCEIVHLAVLYFLGQDCTPDSQRVPPWTGNKFILACTFWLQQNKSSLKT